METYTLEREQTVERSRYEVFAFYSNALNLERITPPNLRFHILTPHPIIMLAGTIIAYRLKLSGLPFRWKTLIEEWSPEDHFVDTQLSGPYALWRHTHTFEAVAPNRTVIHDRVQYRMPFGILGRIVHALFVRRTLEKIFDYRAKATAQLLAPESSNESAGHTSPDKVVEPQQPRKAL
jgi:ligand-binding SRPBCC domain-containing protein